MSASSYERCERTAPDPHGGAAAPAEPRVRDVLVDAIARELIAERDAERDSDGQPRPGREHAQRFADFLAAASRARSASGRF